jgi:hypothetical protein
VLRIQYPCYGHFFVPLNSRRLAKQRELPAKRVRLHFDFLGTLFTSSAALGVRAEGGNITHLAPSLPPSVLCAGKPFFLTVVRTYPAAGKTCPDPNHLTNFRTGVGIGRLLSWLRFI